MAGGERRVSSKDWSDLKNTFKSGCLRHLFVELGGLRQVGSAVKVFHFEQFRATFAWGTHDLGGMNFDEAVLNPVLAHGLLGAGLDFKDQAVSFAAKIQVAPVHAIILVGQGVRERLEGQGKFSVIFNVQRFELNLDATEFHHLVLDYFASDG